MPSMSNQIDNARDALRGAALRDCTPSYPQVAHLAFGEDVEYGRHTMPRWLLDIEASGLHVTVDEQVLFEIAPDTRIDEDSFDAACAMITSVLGGRHIEQIIHETDGSLVLSFDSAQIRVIAFNDPDDDAIDDWSLTDVKAVTELAGLPGGGAELRDASAPLDAPVVLATRS